MSFLPQVSFVNEDGGAVLLDIRGTYSLPSLNDFVWLGEEGSLAEYKVEKISHYYTYGDVINPTSGSVQATVNATITITVSEVV